MSAPPTPNPPEPAEQAVRAITWPVPNEVITSLATGNSYTMGQFIGEGHFGVVYACTDVWNNNLAAKVLKASGRAYDDVRAAAEAEFGKLLALRHPNITYVFDAFEFRDTFYIITERCDFPLTRIFSFPHFNGQAWMVPIARCLLQAIHYLHLGQHAHQDIHPGNIFVLFAKDEMVPAEPGSICFKLGDLGITRVFSELDAANTL